MSSFFDKKLEFLRGVGPQRAELLNKEVNLFTYGDLLEYYPFRHEDRTQFHTVSQITSEMPAAHIKGRIRSVEKLGEKFKQRLVVQFTDGTGDIELVWFQGVAWMEKRLQVDAHYVIYGKPTWFNGRCSISHPEIDPLTPENSQRGYFQPVYPLTEKLRRKYIDGKMIGSWIKTLIEQAVPYIRETLPTALIKKYRLISKQEALYHIHLPLNFDTLHQAQRRLKFEELFYNQLRLVMQKLTRREDYPGQIFDKTTLVTEFYEKHLPFELTNAQVRVIKEIVRDFRSGRQMNRLLQGDVGSGKTIVGFICILVAIDGDAQACMMAPTEILAIQHYEGLKKYADAMGIGIALLTGSSKKKERIIIHEGLQNGDIKIIVGTHALIEDVVQFKNLGLCIIDEQHRFGVAQRAKLWEKNKRIHPHFLVMTATPIPRTLAMAAYGDLDISEIDELPKGRKPIVTKHKYDSHRLEVFAFMRSQIAVGRQVYVVYPLIEESEKLDYKNLMDGYESVARAFPECQLSIVHGKMKAKDKDFEMQRFKRGETEIMVATTVIEVGVDVPNATVMVIENAERFGLSQLHQLRGRVGRGGSQSYCILMSDVKLSADTRKRIQTMVQTNNGFEIAQVDLELRGPGDITGTQQSGIIDLKVANLARDGRILTVAREEVIALLEQDPDLLSPENAPVKQQVENFSDSDTYWSKIS